MTPAAAAIRSTPTCERPYACRAALPAWATTAANDGSLAVVVDDQLKLVETKPGKLVTVKPPETL